MIHSKKKRSRVHSRLGKLCSIDAGLNDKLVSFLRKTPASDLASSRRRSACLAANHESCARDSVAFIWALCAADCASISARN